jgi:tight adherence protein B
LTPIAQRLEAANVTLRPSEWVIVHGLIAVLAGLLATLVSNFNILFAVGAFLVGLLAPWLYLGIKADRRRAEFYQALPDAMQMLAGSLSAGYSLPQAIDNVAHEAGGTLGMEMNRALLESRLGLPLEDTLEAAAQRMQSKDFHWVVMAIRINRQVGGNLGEVLTNVGKTLRERERLRRQVKTLSAEGRLSAWILGILPFGIAFFVVLRNPGYLEPLYTTPIGWVMIGIGVLLYLMGVIWMRNLVNMEV